MATTPMPAWLFRHGDTDTEAGCLLSHIRRANSEADSMEASGNLMLATLRRRDARFLLAELKNLVIGG